MNNQVIKLLPSVLGREQSFLSVELEEVKREIRSTVSNARVLVIGAAGSIGSAFVDVVAQFPLKCLHLIDISENNLAEVVRRFRSSRLSVPDDFKTFAIDYTGPEMEALLRSENYDYVLNFSALKHVRSERDPFTLMRLLEVNILGNWNLIDSLLATSPPTKIFSVSSDKSVNPANLMGASKSFMERLFLSRSNEIPFGSARFANVAFSDGSLLHSFLRRIENGQPLSAPNDIKRYFISHEEGGQLCLLGAFAGENSEIVFPKFEPESDMMTFSEIAKLVLRENGYDPLECEDEEEALRRAGEMTSATKQWPCFFSESNTSGEKPFEEFFYSDEKVDLNRYPNVGIVTYPKTSTREKVLSAIEAIQEIRGSWDWRKESLLNIVREVVPELTHLETHKNLDQKM